MMNKWIDAISHWKWQAIVFLSLAMQEASAQVGGTLPDAFTPGGGEGESPLATGWNWFVDIVLFLAGAIAAIVFIIAAWNIIRAYMFSRDGEVAVGNMVAQAVAGLVVIAIVVFLVNAGQSVVQP